MVTKLKSRAGRCLGLAFASFLVFTLLMSGAALAQERHDAEREQSVQDEFLAEAHAAAAELGAEFGLSADDAASLVDTILFTAPDAVPGANMRRMMAGLSATYGLAPQEIFGFLQLYGAELMAIGQDYGLVPARGAGPAFGPRSAELAERGPVGPRSRWQMGQEEWRYGPRGSEAMRPERGPAYGPRAEQPGMARADAMRNRFRQMHAEFHMRDAGYGYGKAHAGPDMDMGAAQRYRMNPEVLARKAEQAYAWHHAAKDAAVKDGPGPGMYGKRGGPEAWSQFNKRAFAPEAARHNIGMPHRVRMERMRGGQPDFMDEDGTDVSVEVLVHGFEADVIGLEHNPVDMVPVLLDVVGSTIVESLAEATGVPETEMEAIVVQALLKGLDAAMDEGLVTQDEALDMLMLLTSTEAVEE